MTTYTKHCIRLMLMSVWYREWSEAKNYAVEIFWPGAWEARIWRQHREHMARVVEGNE